MPVVYVEIIGERLLSPRIALALTSSARLAGNAAKRKMLKAKSKWKSLSLSAANRKFGRSATNDISDGIR